MRLILIILILILFLVSAKKSEQNNKCKPKSLAHRDPVMYGAHRFRFRFYRRLTCPHTYKKHNCDQCTFEGFYRKMFDSRKTLRALQEFNNGSTSSPDLFISLEYFEFMFGKLLTFERCCFANDTENYLGACEEFRPYSSKLRKYFAGIASNELKDTIKIIERILNKLKHVYRPRKDIKCFNAELLVSSLFTQPLWYESNSWREILVIASIIKRLLRGECIEFLKTEKLFMENTFLQYGNDCQRLSIDRGFTEILTDLQMNREVRYAESRNQIVVCNTSVEITSNLQKTVCLAGNMTNFEDIVQDTFQYAELDFGENEISHKENLLMKVVNSMVRETNVLKCWTTQDLMRLFHVDPNGNIYGDDFRRLCPVLIQQRLSAACISNRNMNAKSLFSPAVKSAGLYSFFSIFLLSAASYVNAFIFKKVKAADYQQWISVLFALSFATMTGHVAVHVVPLFSGFDDGQDLKELSWNNVFPESMLLQLTCTVVLSILIIFRSYIICKGIEKRVKFSRHEELCEAVSRRQHMFSSEPDWRSEISFDYPNESTEQEVVSRRQCMFSFNPNWRSEVRLGYPNENMEHDIFEPVLSKVKQEPLYFVNCVSCDEEIPMTSDILPGTSIEISSPEMIINSENVGSVPEISAADFSSETETDDRASVRKRADEPTVSSTEAVDANQEIPPASIKPSLARYIEEINPNVAEIFAADAIHNFADGMIIHMVFTHSVTAGLWGILTVAFHEFSHEAANVLKLQSINLPFKKVLWINVLSAISSTLGVILSMVLQTAWRRGAEAVIYGLFVEVIMNQLIPELRTSLKDKYDRKLFIKKSLTICCGIAVMAIIRLIELKYGET